MLMAEYDYNTDIEVQCEEAEKRGEQRGEERGIAIGKRSTHLENIRKLYAKNWSIADIAEFVEMPVDEVQKIVQSL